MSHLFPIYYYIPIYYISDPQLPSISISSEQSLNQTINQPQILTVQQNTPTTRTPAPKARKTKEERASQRAIAAEASSANFEPRMKRKYRKRRTWLQKKYRCNMKGCSSKYSSKIALNSHKRKKHPKRPKQMI